MVLASAILGFGQLLSGKESCQRTSFNLKTCFMMNNFIKSAAAALLLITLLITSCNSSKSNNESSNDSTQMELIITKIQNEKDGQTIFMKDDKGGRYTTIISPANGNWVELNVGDRISLEAEEIMESDSAQIISRDIKVLSNDPSSAIESEKTEEEILIKTKITTDKSVYALGEAIKLSMTIQNIGKKAYTFLPWGTPLENELTGDCLEVKHNGEAVQYSGIMVKRMPPTEKDYITIKTNETSSGTVNLLDGYKLDAKGTYTIQFRETYKGMPSSNIVEVMIK